MRWASFAVLLGLALTIPSYRRLMAAKWPTRADALKVVAYGLLLFGPAHALYYYCITLTSSFEGTILGSTAPIWSTAMAFFFLKEIPNRWRMIGIALGTIGAYIVIAGFQVPNFDSGHGRGNLLYVLAVIMETIAGVLSIRIARRSSGITALWFQVFGGAAFLAIAPIAMPSIFPFAVPPAMDLGWLCLAYLIFIAGFINFAIWYRLAERVPVSLLALSLLIQPPLAIAAGMIFRDEKLTTNIILGSILIFAGLIVGTAIRSRSKEPDGVPSEA